MTSPFTVPPPVLTVADTDFWGLVKRGHLGKCKSDECVEK